MRKIIYTVAVGESECFKHCVESQKRYAKKVGAEFYCCIEWTDLYNENLKTDSEKRFVVELLKTYDKVLYLDADVFIRDNAEDIFYIYQDTNKLVIYNEVMFNNVQMDVHIEPIVKQYDIKWSKTKGHYDWLNAGVMLCSKGNEKVFEYNERDFFKFPAMPSIYDMPYMHYNIYKYNIPIMYMDERFNTMVYFHDQGDFLHFANVLDRDERIKNYV
jgi:lipopolysaccharide biosynthesis glycosyltransferase